MTKRPAEKMAETEIRVLSVGQSLDPTREIWPEGTHYTWDGTQHELVLHFGDTRAIERDAVQRGRFQFGLLVEGPVIFLLFKPGAMPWSDATMDWHRINDGRPLPPVDLEEGERASIRVILVDPEARGRIEALRVMTFSPGFTRALHRAIRDQARAPADAEAARNVVTQIYAKWQPETLYERCTIRCNGGD
jgi:hypothetical protein